LFRTPQNILGTFMRTPCLNAALCRVANNKSFDIVRIFASCSFRPSVDQVMVNCFATMVGR
jgi:hypothetical protein